MASQTIVGPDLQYTQDNLRCFAYSGVTVANNNTVQQLFFTTGGGTILAKYQFFLDIESISSNKAIGFNIKLDGVLIIESIYFSSAGTAVADIDIPVVFIIPPHTTVLIETVTTNTANINTYGTLTGRVYDYLPVRN